MYLTWLEKLAIKETGRKIAADGTNKRSRLVVYPQELTLTELVEPYRSGKGRISFTLAYSMLSAPAINRIWYYMKFALACLRHSFVTDADIFICSSGDGRVYGMIAAILVRLFGGCVTIHDYRFHDNLHGKSKLRTVAQRIEFGACPEQIPDDSRNKRISCRSESIPDALYDIPAKTKIAPNVFVYGDFERNRVVSLARRTHDLVKQKYPRTEFILLGLFPEELTAIGHVTGIYSIRAESAENDAKMARLMSEADIGLFLTPGGLARYFCLRAIRARIPLFTNGFTLSDYNEDPRQYVATRDSYSDIAGRIITLADNPELYAGRAARE